MGANVNSFETSHWHLYISVNGQRDVEEMYLVEGSDSEDENVTQCPLRLSPRVSDVRPRAQGLECCFFYDKM